MARHFENHFVEKLSEPKLEQTLNEAAVQLSRIDVVRELPVRNQQAIFDMANFMICSANEIILSGDDWRENYWGLYIVGSRATGQTHSASDLDMLSVGTFYSNLRFPELWGRSSWPKVFEGFEVEMPDELPDQYNLGEVDRKYLLRAAPQSEGVLPIDLNVVDMTFDDSVGLDDFLVDRDVDNAGEQLPRIPLVELIIEADRFIQF